MVFDIASSKFSPAKTFPYNRKLKEIGLKAIESNSRKPTAKKTKIIIYLMKPELSPLGPNRWSAKPMMPLERKAQKSHNTMKIADIADVMFKSAFPPRKSGWGTSKPCGVCSPQPIVPIPGISPNQFVKRMKIKIVAKNQNDFFTNSPPIMSAK